MNEQVLMMTTSASLASGITRMPACWIWPTMISLSTRFFAHPREMRLTVIIEGSDRQAQERRPARLALRPAAFAKRLFRHGLCRGPLRHPPAFEIGMAAFPFDDFVVLSAHKVCFTMVGSRFGIVKCCAPMVCKER